MALKLLSRIGDGIIRPAHRARAGRARQARGVFCLLGYRGVIITTELRAACYGSGVIDRR